MLAKTSDTQDDRCDRPRRDVGTTLIEILVSVVILGTAGVAVLAGLATTARGAVVHRTISDGQAWLATSGDAISDPENPYSDCASNSEPQIRTDYENSIVDPITGASMSAPTVDVISVRFWDSSTGTFGTSCRYASDGDRLQLVTIRTTVQGKTSTLSVVKRPPSTDIPSVGVGPLPPTGGGNVIPDPNPFLIP